MTNDKFSRLDQWNRFSDVVYKHIKDYTLVQYGDSDTDDIDNFSIEDCWKNVSRYFTRRRAAVRGRQEQKRDILKIAHYMCFIYYKMEKEDNA